MFSNKLAITWRLFGDSGDYLAIERSGFVDGVYALIALSGGDEQFTGLTEVT